MNRPILRLYGLVAVLFALLVAFTSRWTVFDASSLRENKLNARALLEQERIHRGPIVAANGKVLARDVRGGESTYRRSYPTGSAFANAVGYDYIDPGTSGVEQFRDSALDGRGSTNLQSILNQLQGKEPEGDKVVTTLQPGAQEVADAKLAGHEGAVVALEPRSGAVTVMASSPSYDPNTLRTSAGYEEVARDRADPLVNRATQYGYAPGSSFKIVTATAAIDTGMFTPETTLSGRNGILVSGVPLDNDQDESFGQISLTQALAKSVNTVYAQVAERLGKRTLARYMSRFGFGRKPELDYPAAEMSASGEYEGEKLLAPTSPNVDVGRLGIGQDKLDVTALQMAEVAAAVANDGRLMVPHLTARIVDPEGSVVDQIAPRVQSVVMRPSTAKALTAMMEAVVNEGTGEAAKIPGVQVAGKTGTAETEIGNALNNVWFVAFAPAENPRVVVAATLRKVPGYGAVYALPVVRAVMERLLSE
ncbi:MAG: peptidoglycan D,D-transpeptidase FtsI family protein [Solirubrobacteraceae bacterium]